MNIKVEQIFMYYLILKILNIINITLLIILLIDYKMHLNNKKLRKKRKIKKNNKKRIVQPGFSPQYHIDLGIELHACVTALGNLSQEKEKFKVSCPKPVMCVFDAPGNQRRCWIP